MTNPIPRDTRSRFATKSVIALGLGLALASHGQIPSQFDPHPFGETGRPVGLAGSAFEVWVAYPSALLQFRRMGDDTPKWFGTNQGLPGEGIASICFDEPSQSLWVRSSTERWFRWSAGLESAREETPPAAGCVSRLGKPLDIASIANLNPAPAGWIRMGSDLVDPRGARIRIQHAMSLDDRELWLATDQGVWTGRSITGRIEPRTTGLAEACATRIAPDSSGVIWLQGCEGSFTALRDGNPRATFLTTDSRNADLRSSRLVGTSSSRGVWVSVADGLVRLSIDGFEDRLLGRKAPFGGRVLSIFESQDTLWVGTQNSLSFRVRSKTFSVDVPPWETPGPVNALLSTPTGLLAATNDGFWLRVGTTWMRPAWLKRAQTRNIVHAVVESQEPFRVAWWDGREACVDTLPGHGGKPDRWLPERTPLRALEFDREGRLHLALGGSWFIRNLQSGETREWKAGLGLTGDIYDVHVQNDRAILAGVGGGASVRIPSYAPPSSSPK
jgi:hypothetical protein